MSLPSGQFCDFFKTSKACSTRSGIRVEDERESEDGNSEDGIGSTESVNVMIDVDVDVMK